MKTNELPPRARSWRSPLKPTLAGSQTWRRSLKKKKKKKKKDETFVSQRKHQRGARQREEGILTFVGGVTVGEVSFYDENGDAITRTYVLEGVIFGVPSKARAEQSGLMMQVTRPGATITTDGARMYDGLSGAGRIHRVVNHRVTFVSKEGYHANAIEGFWSTIKKRSRALFSGGGLTGKQVGLRYQLCAFLQNMSLKDCPQRLSVLLLAREHIRLRIAEQRGQMDVTGTVQKVAELICAPSAKALRDHVARRIAIEREEEIKRHKEAKKKDPNLKDPSSRPPSPPETPIPLEDDVQPIAFEAAAARAVAEALEAAREAVADADAVEEAQRNEAEWIQVAADAEAARLRFEAQLSYEDDLAGPDLDWSLLNRRARSMADAPGPLPGFDDLPLNQLSARRSSANDTLLVGSAPLLRSHRAESGELAAGSQLATLTGDEADLIPSSSHHSSP